MPNSASTTQRQENPWEFSMKKCILNTWSHKTQSYFLPWDPTKFIYQSQRDGYNHLYLFDADAANMKGETYNSDNGGTYFQAGKVKQLTKGNWLVSDVLGFNTKRKEIIFTAVEGLRSDISL